MPNLDTFKDNVSNETHSFIARLFSTLRDSLVLSPKFLWAQENSAIHEDGNWHKFMIYYHDIGEENTPSQRWALLKEIVMWVRNEAELGAGGSGL
jgi:hypothetical protein